MKKCIVENCENIYYGKGYCRKCHAEMTRLGIITSKRVSKKIKCKICGKFSDEMNYCMSHSYLREYDGNNMAKYCEKTMFNILKGFRNGNKIQNIND
jgi:hypothetical protein